jgi:AcrR family transcriptional regulator
MCPKTRARPLSPEQRRSAILDAVIPLLMNKGAAVTTADIASAAGIAEGTIFRVFPDKRALLHAAMKKTLDPQPIQAALGALDEDLPLADKLVAGAAALSERFERVTALIGVLRSIPHSGADSSHEDEAKPNTHRYAGDAMAAIATALTEVMEHHRNELAVEPARAAVILRGLVFANTHPMLRADDRMTPEQIVDILLTGVLRSEVN